MLLFCFETGSHDIALADPTLAMQTRAALNSQGSACLLRAGMLPGLPEHGGFMAQKAVLDTGFTAPGFEF